MKYILLITGCILCLGCSNVAVVKDVPVHFRPGLYVTPQSIEIAENKYDADEGYLIVNENPPDSLTRTIKLPVLRIRSANNKPGEPIFWLNGGPGQSNMKYSGLTRLLENHDFVLLGYRGVDGSVLLRSKEIEQSFKGAHDNLLSDSSLRTISQAIKSFSDTLSSLGVDLSHYTMADVVSDLESVRKAFRYEKINLLSLSYGTRVALLYSYLHPAVIYRSVMVSVNPPGHFTFHPKKIDEQLRYYDQLFAKDSIHFDGRPLSLSIQTALKKIPSRWSIFKLDPDKIKLATFSMLFHKGSAAIVFDCYRKAEQGDYSGLYMFQRAYDFMMPSMMVWGDLFAKGITDFDTSINYLSAMRDSSTIMGSPFSLLIMGGAAGYWPVHRIPSELQSIQPSDVQTLLVGGSVDFSTPAEYATEELLPSLTNGRQVILKEMGHVGDIVNLQRPAFEHMVYRFYNEGVVDDSKFIYDPMNFDPSMNLPLWTKVLYPFVLILSIF